MRPPRLCPICCRDIIAPIGREILLSTYLGDLAMSSCRALAYHCNAGHVFLVTDNHSNWNGLRKEGNGYAMIV